MPMPPDDRFHELLLDALQGEPSALGEVYRLIYPRVLRYIRALEPRDAEDVASDAWLDLARALPRFRGDEADLRALAFTIARRRVLDLRRRRARQRTNPVSDERLAEIGGIGDSEADALEAIERGWAIDLIARSLPAEQAEIVLLRVLGDLSVADVARIVGRRPGTVRVIQHRALRRLARVLEREGVTR
jgi:RNA polymerase sigma-70 factor (ECF subfamily)